ncbi:MAG: hypothetical protein MRZ45_10700 [Blautia sp.]|nr:hypothetical protein [Blautia sp.]
MKMGTEKFAGFLGVFLSFAGSVTAFLIFLERYFQVETETKSMILTRIAESGAKQEELLTLLVLPAAAVMVFFWITGILIYKLIFFIARVSVTDISLRLALGSGYIVAFLLGTLLIERVPFLIVVVVTNLVEAAIIYFALYDQIREKIGVCLPFSCILLLVNVIFIL